MGKRGIIFLAFMAMVLSMSAQVNKATSSQTDSSRIFVDYEENAQFPGGDMACKKWMQEHIKYPEGCRSDSIQGRVIVSFIVERDGSLDSIKVVRSPDPALSEEAIRLVSEMPRWKPARYYNKTIRSRYTLPIVFKLH